MSKDATLKEKRERWHEQLAKDIYVEEALNVLEDLQTKKVIKKPITPKLKTNPLVKS